MFSTFRHLLPDGDAFILQGRSWPVACGEPEAECGDPQASCGNMLGDEKQLSRLIRGLADSSAQPRQFLQDAWLDLFPTTTRRLSEWERQFGLFRRGGLSEQERRNRLAAAWETTGGQSPRYMQDTLRDRGFDVWVHEWWVPGSHPLEVRDPNEYVGEGEDGFVLVNKILTASTTLIMTAGAGIANAGNPRATAGNTGAQRFLTRTYTVPLDPDKWRFFIYIGGETFGDTAQVPADRQDEFEDLCLEICPLQLWMGMLVEYA